MSIARLPFSTVGAASRKRSIKICTLINVNLILSFFRVGELEVAKASNVCLYVAQKIKAQSKKKKNTPSNRKLVGLLVITNFRLCFIPFDDEHKDDKKVNDRVDIR